MADQKRKVLAIDSATKICSVSIRDAGGKIHTRTEVGSGIHSEMLFIFIDELLNECNLSVDDLDAVLTSDGPGSYTGLRIAASAVKGLLFNRDIPLFGINTLAYFAKCAFSASEKLKKVHAVIDARRVHVYHQLFSRDSTFNAVTEVDIREINSFPSIIEPGDGIIGTGLQRFEKDILDTLQIFDIDYIQASGLIDLFDLYIGAKITDTKDPVIKKVAPNDFVPYYYGSMHVRHSVK